LLNYFGDTTATRCGVCDVCTERNKLDLSKMEFDLVAEAIKTELKKQPLNLEQLVDAIKQPNNKVVKVIQWLLDNQKLHRDESMLLHWKKTETE
jgi:ATP-dependent DNA helicase RecQ